MKLLKTFLYSVVILSFVSCRESAQRVRFPAPEVISTSRAVFDNIFMQYPFRVAMLKDTTVCISDLHGPEYFCHEFARPSMRHLHSFARRGKAPGEMTSMGNFARSDKGLYLLDVFARKIYLWNGEAVHLCTELPFTALDFTLYNDSTFIMPDHTGECRFIFTDMDGTIIRRVGKIPANEHRDIPPAALGQAWRGFIHFNKENEVLAIATQFGDVLEVYYLQSGTSHATVGPDGEPRFRYREATASPDGVMGYSYVYVGKQHIYAIYWGHAMDDIKQGKVTVEGGSLFRVFDLKGNPVRQYRLDCHVTGFCIDENTGEVLATDPNNELLVLFKVAID